MKRNDLVDKTIDLYNGSGWKKYFSRIRFWDAPYLEVEKIVPKRGKIIDLGCGEGIFSNFLALSSSSRMITGIELDKNRVRHAYHNLPNTIFRQGDATRVKIPKSNVIIVFHLLHHLRSFFDQEKVIKNCHKALVKGGKLIIVEVDIKPTLKYLVSWLTDHLIVPILFEKRIYEPNIYFRKRKDWLILLNKIGFLPKAIPAERNKPFTHIIFSCIKK